LFFFLPSMYENVTDFFCSLIFERARHYRRTKEKEREEKYPNLISRYYIVVRQTNDRFNRQVHWNLEMSDVFPFIASWPLPSNFEFRALELFEILFKILLMFIVFIFVSKSLNKQTVLDWHIFSLHKHYAAMLLFLRKITFEIFSCKIHCIIQMQFCANLLTTNQFSYCCCCNDHNR